mgnify:CR=1 FL=1
MIDLEEWIEQLDEEDHSEIKDNENYQHELFQKYVLKINSKNSRKRRMLWEEYNKDKTKLFGAKGLRKQLAAFDLEYFGRAYIGHFFKRESPAFHEELDEVWTNGVIKNIDCYRMPKEIDRKQGSRNAIAAPRGHAKSTNFTFKDTLHAVLYGYKHYIMIISDTGDQAEEFLDDIKTELEDNYNIIQDFGELKGSKAWRSNVFVTKTNIKVEALGSGKKVRGRRHKEWRPDLIVLDDLENDENVMTPEQRKKLYNWYTKAVSECGDTYTDFMYIGTILHYDSLLSKVLKIPSYDTKVYRAVLSDAENQKLWEEWERIYTNLFDDQHKENAQAFYDAHEDEMLEGTQVLWEAKCPYLYLMIKKVEIGIAAFNSELQNNPIDPENADFNEEWLDYYDDNPPDFKASNFVFVGANDPSLGKNKKSDTSSIIGAALDLNTGYLYIIDASVEKRKPDVIITDVIEMHKRYKRDYGRGFYKFGVETVQFQFFFKDVMTEKALEAGEYIPIEEIISVVNKVVRIRSLQPFIKNKWIKFSRLHKELIKQLCEFPMGAHDDAPDGLQMVVALTQVVRSIAAKFEYKTVSRRKLRFGKGAY